ncbi:MAG: iron-siderophore ABC transporter substrate-binding protein [Actinomycetota bacterium]
MTVTDRRPLLIIALVLALFAAACGGGDDDSGDDAGSASESASASASESESASASASEAADEEPADPASVDDTASSDHDTDDADEAEAPAGPIVVTHKFGETEVPRDPQRVLSLGFSDQDDLLALGVVPVGILDWFGDQPNAVWPWAQPLLGDAEPTVIPAVVEPNVELIASVDPDLIVAVSQGLTREQYDLLSELAPTVAQHADYADYRAPWQERTRLIGSIFDKADEAEALIRGVEDRFAEVRAAHPEFEGLSAAVAFAFNGQPGVYASSDVRAQILESIGFQTPAEYDELAGEAFFVNVSEERVDLLDTDVVVWIATDEVVMQDVLQSPIRDVMRAPGEGREIFTPTLVSGAFSFGSPLSIGYLLDELVPELALAVDGDPATAVPSAVAIGAVG